MTPTARRSSGIVLRVGMIEPLRIPAVFGDVRKISYRYPNPMIETNNRKAYSSLRALSQSDT
jgi:hypothetical protein